MPQCNIIGCGSRRRKKPQLITLHRLPTIESKRKAWLEIIGSENIDTARKYVFVCSLHFEDSCFNKTMNIIKLRDDALPSRTLLTLHLPGSENKPGTSSVLISQHGVPDTPIHALQIIKKLKEKCQKQAKKIKRLNETVRRQVKKIAQFATMIEDLKQSNLLNSTKHVTKRL